MFTIMIGEPRHVTRLHFFCVKKFQSMLKMGILDKFARFPRDLTSHAAPPPAKIDTRNTTLKGPISSVE